MTNQINDIFNANLFATCCTVLDHKDVADVFNKEANYRRALDMLDIGESTYETIDAGGNEEYANEKAIALAKKLIWMSAQCYNITGKRFITCWINKDDITDVLKLSKAFGLYVDMATA